MVFLSNFRSGILVFSLIVAASLVACSKPDDVSATTERLTLPVSLNEVMVALVNDAAAPISVATLRNPETTRDWLFLERKAYQLEVAGALLGVPGKGPNDKEWVSSPAWQQWAAQLRHEGAAAVTAAKARNFEAIAAAGDNIVAICEGCHAAFKPDLPTSGVFANFSLTAEDSGDEDSYDGFALYSVNCVNCHGVYGEGDGAVAPMLSLVLKDLRYLSQRNGGEFPTQFVTEIIDGRATRASHGPEGMPVWGVEFARGEGFNDQANARVDEKIQALVRFLESLQLATEKAN